MPEGDLQNGIWAIKIRADGLEPSHKILCHRWSGLEETRAYRYVLSGFRTWSPDGADSGPSCSSMTDTRTIPRPAPDACRPCDTDCLERSSAIPYEPRSRSIDLTVGDCGQRIPSATWNDDGSKIAFLEAEFDANDWVVNLQLAILENGENGLDTLHIPVTPLTRTSRFPGISTDPISTGSGAAIPWPFRNAPRPGPHPVAPTGSTPPRETGAPMTIDGVAGTT